jgi:altronate dehydratase large subunit
MNFMGYKRADGKFGIRNHVAVIPTVVCACDVAQAIVRQVQGTVGMFHHQGCCQLPPDLERVTDTLIGLACSPNVGAVLVVSLGCEGTDHERLVKAIKATGKPVEIIAIQELGGTSRGIQAGIDAAEKLVIAISGQQRESAPISDLVLSIKCGASDATSGMASNCVIGYIADKNLHRLFNLSIDITAARIVDNRVQYLAYGGVLAHRCQNVGKSVFGN